MTAAAVGSAAWYAERRSYIGASQAAGALGLSPYDDPIEVWAEKTMDDYVPKESNFRMQLGQLVEPVIGVLYEQRTGQKLRAGGVRLRRHKEHPFIAAHPDFNVVGQRRLVQAKLSDAFEDGIPFHYRVQGAVELACTGYDAVDFAVLTPYGFAIYEQARDEGEIADVVADLDEWWNSYVVPKIPPPPSHMSGKSLRRMYPGNDTKIGKVASAEQEEAIRTLVDLKAQRKKLEEFEQAQANAIKAMIGDASWLEGAGKRLTWSRFTVREVGWEQIAKAYRELLEKEDAGHVVDPETGALKLDVIEGLYTTARSSDRLSISNVK